MSECPSRDQLELLCKGQLTGDENASVSAHLKQCALCQEKLSLFLGSDTVIIDAQPARKSDAAAAAAAAVIPVELADHPRYRVLELLSVGGMGAVYKGRHLFLERFVVLKVIRRDLLSNLQHVLRFEREAKLAAALSHPNIVTVYEAEKAGEIQFLVMEFLAGQDLGRRVKELGPLSVTDACGWILQASVGLECIHEHRMVHRDIKPSNLFLTEDGWVKILDLGLACLRGKSESGAAIELTQHGEVFGTVGFCSPEQLEESGDVDIRADIYSLGCTLYHLLAGQPPFAHSASIVEHMWAHGHEPVPPIDQIRSDVPEGLIQVLNRMLAKQPSDRYPTPAAVAEALTPFAGRSAFPSGSASAALAAASTAARGRNRWTSWPVLAGIAAVILVAAALIYLLLGRRPGSQAVFAGGPPIKVGILHSRTGTMGTSELPVVDATLFAIEEINDAGGLLGRRIEAVLEDGESDPATFAGKAEKLIAQDQVITVFGCWTSASRKAVKSVVEKHDNLLLYPVQNEGLEQSPNIIYLGAAPNQQIIPAVRWCVSFLNKRRLFLVGSDYIFPRAANAIIRDQAKALEAEIVGEEYLPLGSVQTEDIVEKIRRSKADIILNTINGDTNIAFFRSLRGAGILASQIPTMSFSIGETALGSLRAQDLAGDYAAWNYFQKTDRSQNEQFVNRFHERLGSHRVISDPMEAAYAGVKLWAQAVKAAGSVEAVAIRQAILGQSFDAPEGPIRIDPATGRTTKFIRIGKMTEGGQYEIIYSSDVAIDPVPYPETRSKAEWDAFLTNLQLSWGGEWANPKR
jgi:urea transport system substrate-binding protein